MTEAITAPRDHTAERAILGCAMLSEQALDAAVTRLSPMDFDDKRNRQIFEAMRALSAVSKPVDEVTVGGLVRFESANVYLHGVVSTTPMGEHVGPYLDQVRDKTARRAILEAARDAVDLATKSTESVQVIADKASAAMSKAVIEHNDEIATPIRELVRVEFNRIERMKAGDKRPGLFTGYYDIDRRLGGWQPGNLYIIAARPGMGKTALATRAAQGAAEQGAKTLIFSMEMSKEELVQRQLAQTARVSLTHIRNGTLSAVEWLKVTQAADVLHRPTFDVSTDSDLTILQLRSKARRWRAQRGGIDLIVVDYLQLMSGGDRRGEREREVAEISRGLKALAMELQIPVIALSQLNRGVEARPDKRPRLSDLRESGAVEQDADAVLFIYRDDYYHPDTDEPGVAEIIFGKNRHGATGGDAVKLNWDGPCTRFDSYSDRDPDSGQLPFQETA